MPGLGLGISPFFYKPTGGSGPTIQNVQAIGGTITYITNESGTFKRHEFDFSEEVQAFELIANASAIPIGIMAAGGGGAGGGGNGGGGGAGADCYYNANWSITTGVHGVSVGKGGIVIDNPSFGSGDPTIVGGLTVEGGGRGGGSSSPIDGYDPGGGGARGGAFGPAGTYNLKRGGVGENFGTGGGGGCGTQGQDGLPGLGGGPTVIINGNGGDGMEVIVAGETMTVCAGGAGGNTNEANNYATGGLGGGGSAFGGATPGGSGTGIGCGGAGSTSAGPGAGSDGKVYVWYEWFGPEVDYSPTLTMLSSDTGLTGRDSALKVNITSSATLLLGGWNPAFLPDSVTDEAYITNDFITFTPIDSMPVKMDHAFAAIRNDGYLWVVGSQNNGDIGVCKLYLTDYLSSGDPTDLVWTLIDDTYTTVYGGNGTIHNDLLKILVWNGTNAEVWTSSTGLPASWSKESDLPAGYILNSGMYTTEDGKMRVGGGADSNDPSNTLYDKVLEWNEVGSTWDEVGTLPFSIQGCWMSLFQKGIYEYAIAGFNNSVVGSQGRLWRRYMDGDDWELLGFTETVEKHAIPFVVRGNYIYISFGSILAENWSMRINNV